MGVEPKIGVPGYPQIINFNRVWNHDFPPSIFGFFFTSIFGNIHINSIFTMYQVDLVNIQISTLELDDKLIQLVFSDVFFFRVRNAAMPAETTDEWNKKNDTP